jgi:PhzF family phenazine biosynthesis protein
MSTSNSKLFHLASFATGNEGGNPAGVWIGDELPSPDVMQQIAADVGASETAFIAPSTGQQRTVRYYSPEVEVSFCGHATIASGIVLGRENGEGAYIFHTSIGEVEVVAQQHDGQMEASLQSVDTQQDTIGDADLQEALECLRWSSDDLDPSIPSVKAYAGAWHLVLAVKDANTLTNLDYDFEGLKSFMQRNDLTTLQLVWREREDLFHSRNPFPIGGIVEDPATGAAAAALGGYLRDAELIDTPFNFDIRQGEAMGMPSLIRVEVPENGGIIVTGTARDI